MNYRLKKIVLVAMLLTSFGFIFCQENFSLTDVNRFDRLFAQSYNKTFDTAGTITAAISFLTPAALLAAPTQDYWKIGLGYGETMLLAYGAKELIKYFVDRPRPYMYFDGVPQNEIENGDWDDSFVSGHTTLSFAAATFTTFVFCQYFPDSPWKIPIIATSFTLAAATAGLRIASGNHFITDVLAGAGLGTAIGFLVPWVNSFWLKPSLSKSCTGTISPLGFSFCMSL